MAKKLHPRQVRAARLLAYGETTNSITSKLKVRRETLSRWKRLPAFKAQMEQIIEEERIQMQYKLSRLADTALETLWDEMQFIPGGNPRVRLQAALSVLRLLGVERLVLPSENSAAAQANMLLNVDASAASTSAIEASTPSAASDATPCSWTPQGTIPA
jgi:hypothetical protein